MPDQPVNVIFRADKAGEFKGEVTAVFLDEGNDWGEYTCCAHIGQHGACTRQWVRTRTRPATPKEYADLKRELEALGYTLNVRRRWTH